MGGGREGGTPEGGREGGWGEAAGQRRMGAGWGRGVVSTMSGPCGGGKGERGRGGAGRGGNGGANGHDIKLWECARQDLFSSKIRFYSATASSTTSTKIGQMHRAEDMLAKRQDRWRRVRQFRVD